MAGRPPSSRPLKPQAVMSALASVIHTNFAAATVAGRRPLKPPAVMSALASVIHTNFAAFKVTKTPG